MDRLLRLSELIGRPVARVGLLAGWLAVPLCCIVVFDVVIRKVPFLRTLIHESWLYAFLSSTKLQEWEWHLHGVILLAAFGLTYTADRHVRIDGWRERLSPRKQALIEIIGVLFCLFPYALLMLWQSAQFAAMSYVIDEGSTSTVGLGNRWIIKGAMIGCYLLLLAAGVSVLLRAIVFFLRPPNQRPHFGILDIRVD
jgi:TRAP-type mannitol/chloroaromatic compound transport system permease small subunit